MKERDRQFWRKVAVDMSLLALILLAALLVLQAGDGRPPVP